MEPGPARPYNRREMRRLLPALLAATLVIGAHSGAAAGESDIPDEKSPPPAPQATEPAPDAPDAPPPKSLDLDRLLRPPAVSLQPAGKTYGGRNERGWKEEFRKARQEVSDLEGKVEAGQEHLRSASAGEWNYSPAGGEVTDPEVLKLRAQLKRDRQSLEASRQRLRDLDVEASLAGVPEDWRKP
jgi:hypothetical protein